MDSIYESDESYELPPFSLRRTFPGGGSGDSLHLSPSFRPTVATSDAGSDPSDSEQSASERNESHEPFPASPVRAWLSPPFARQRVPPVPPLSLLEPSVAVEQGSPGSSVGSCLSASSPTPSSLGSSLDEYSMHTLRGSMVNSSDAALSPSLERPRKRPGSTYGGSAQRLAPTGVQPAGGPQPQRQRCDGLPSTPLGRRGGGEAPPGHADGEGVPRSWTPLRAVTARDAHRLELEPRSSQLFTPGDAPYGAPPASPEPPPAPFDRTEPLLTGAQGGWLLSPDAVPGSSARLCACFVSPAAGGAAAGTSPGTSPTPTPFAPLTPFAPPTPRQALSVRPAPASPPPRRPGASLDGHVLWHPGEPFEALSWEPDPLAPRVRTESAESASSHESMLSHPDELEGLMGQPEGIMGRRYSLVQGEMAPSPQQRSTAEDDAEGGGPVMPQLFSYSK